MSRLERFRANRDTFFKSDGDSPLQAQQQEQFNGLSYYPENQELHFEVELDSEAASREQVSLPTTTGDSKSFVRAGKVHLTIEGQQVSLTLFREQGRGRYFLPFRDATAGEETYHLGRYLDPQETPRGTVIVDFNYAYNPYCAYGEGWSCPIPPEENHLNVAVKAGEKEFPLERHSGGHHHHH